MIDKHERKRILGLRDNFRGHANKIESYLNNMSQFAAEAGLPADSRAIDGLIYIVQMFRRTVLSNMDRKAQVLRATIGEGKPAGG